MTLTNTAIPPRLTSKDLSEEADVPWSTTRKLLKDLDIPPIGKNGNGHPVYSPEVVRVLETVKKLKGDKRGMSTITQAIAPALAELKQQAPSAEQMPDTDKEPLSTDTPLPQQIDIRAEITAAIKDATDLAEKYSRATYQIGKLETENEHHLKRIQELEQQVKLLPDPTAIALLEQRLAQAEQALESERQALAESKNELEAEKKKTWWQKLFG